MLVEDIGQGCSSRLLVEHFGLRASGDGSASNVSTCEGISRLEISLFSPILLSITKPRFDDVTTQRFQRFQRNLATGYASSSPRLRQRERGMNRL